ncbi:MAG: lysine--tRNA ligase [Defluviitaleaceae bacterium]|nr:lysine--tRNA ligase [Defluviitaleaceae bacterium]MCL2275208.1 lysine--tRNA ligase [Defluviitaleaceae bacterium]
MSEQVQVRLEKLQALQAQGRDPFLRTIYTVDTHSKDIHNNFESFEGKNVSVAGRLMTKRMMGKASFIDVQDEHGRIQVYVKGENTGEDAYEDFKNFDIGDIIGVQGTVFLTQKGEKSVKATGIDLLAKSLHVLPEKFHGLTDKETRYRQRYLDLIVNPDVRDVFVKRTAIVKAIRAFLDARGYLEVDTPILQTIAGGASARPFITHHNTMDMQMYMRIALELPLKRLIVGGFERVYEMGRNFRNEGISLKHNPEFTMLELYEAYTDYHGIMALVEEMFRHVAQTVLGKTTISYEGHEIDLSKPFARISMAEAVKQHTGVDFYAISTPDDACAAAKEHGVHVEPHFGKGHVLEAFFDKFVEHHLIQPTFILDHPIEISPLTKKKPDKPEYTERFELFIVGKEFGNAYSELNDPVDQRARFEYQESQRAAGDDEANMIDEDFLTAIEYGMPPTGGYGMGIDRFVMLLTDSASIRDVLFFPTMKPV